MKLEYPKGATPIDADEAQGLIPKNIMLQSELNEYEQANILEADIWLFRKALPINSIISSEFIKSVHKKMFGKVWRWSGQFRKSDKHIELKGTQDKLEKKIKRVLSPPKPNLKNAKQEHQDFVMTLKENGVTVVYHDEDLPQLSDAIYVHDPVLMTNQGAIILSMGKPLRNGEEDAIQRYLEKNNIPIAYRLRGQATAEGGDMLWLDDKTLIIGRSFRTNGEGIKQLRNTLAQFGTQVISYDLPVDQGIDACLHLQSLISLVNANTAVIYRKLMPVSLLNELEHRNFKLIDVPENEYLTMGPNILAIQPNLVLTIEGNPITKKRLEEAGVIVLTYKGDDISLKAEGGATCLTRPILRG